nr:probable pre-mRNA-splicing factor ATP-dependent RNA helicase DEAH4 [Tanacetum cinerariifolium]
MLFWAVDSPFTENACGCGSGVGYEEVEVKAKQYTDVSCLAKGIDSVGMKLAEIQRSSIADGYPYLKSLDLPDIDILISDFLDARESLQDALKQLFFIDAIDANLVITHI